MFEGLTGGSPDGGTDTGATTDGGATEDAGTCPSNAFFCDDFERGIDARWLKQDTGQPGALEVQGGAGRNGSAALFDRLEPGGSADARKMLTFDSAPRTSGMLAVRAYLRAGTVPVDTILFTVFGAGAGDAQACVNAAIAVAVGPNETLSVNKYLPCDTSAPALKATTTTSIPLARDVFRCVALEIDIGATGALRLYVDDKVVAQAAGNTLGGYVSYGRVGVGIAFARASADVYVDDVAMATSHLGCP